MVCSVELTVRVTIPASPTSGVPESGVPESGGEPVVPPQAPRMTIAEMARTLPCDILLSPQSQTTGCNSTRQSPLGLVETRDGHISVCLPCSCPFPGRLYPMRRRLFSSGFKVLVAVIPRGGREKSDKYCLSNRSPDPHARQPSKV